MGRNRKPFIDKKQATTYNLLYRANEIGMDGEAAGPERELVDASRRVGIGCVDESAIAAAASRSGSRYPSGHPLAWLQVLQLACRSATSIGSCHRSGYCTGYSTGKICGLSHLHHRSHHQTTSQRSGEKS